MYNGCTHKSITILIITKIIQVVTLIMQNKKANIIKTYKQRNIIVKI
jgi:hypothetical protein